MCSRKNQNQTRAHILKHKTYFCTQEKWMSYILFQQLMVKLLKLNHRHPGF